MGWGGGGGGGGGGDATVVEVLPGHTSTETVGLSCHRDAGGAQRDGVTAASTQFAH